MKVLMEVLTRRFKGTTIHERIMTVLTAWTQQGLNSFQMLRAKLRMGE
ncbi:MAG: hypothetical protein SCAL_000799 [Candidatus Syntrophoarchaeum caldarius]|uniref:Uncharacterized protein n=1 Tax=Candidatus Syntropharchaeum caldarium TaxID=1838285 RepID=A0A1F2P9X0_9EURY|nr:MAG: hypothetical protein SCAL_000799 [Candidatus Syntrophoarchaeum caldarius]